MKFFRLTWHISWLFVFGILGLYGCSPQNSIIDSTPTIEWLITPYLSKTATKIPSEKTNLPNTNQAVTLVPSPTPTPVIYTIVKGDTFSSIAFHHGIKLNDLIAANPRIDPNFLTIGITVTIPISGSNSSTLLFPTPIPIGISSPICYPDSTGGQWCLVLVENTQSYNIENISANFYLVASNQETVNKLAFSPLNVLPAGKSIPLIAYFPPPNPAEFQPRADLISVIPMPADTERYLNPIIKNQIIEISDLGLQAVVSGEVSIQENKPAAQIWIIAVAYNQEGNPVGYRKWESINPLLKGENLSFEFKVYSLGPPIDYVELLIEARP